MRRCLVVIDHTLGGTGLTWAVREHAHEESDIQVDVIVPARNPKLTRLRGASKWSCRGYERRESRQVAVSSKPIPMRE